jgi:O-antigen ligase
MASVAWMSAGAERGRTESAWPPAWPWVAVAVLALGAGAAACFASPALGIAALALPAAPLLVVAPDLAVLALVAALPFDALAAVDESGMLTLTRLLGIAVLGGWVVHVVAHPARRVRLGRPGLLLLAYVAFAAVSIGWSADTDLTLTALLTLAQLFLLYVMAANVFDDWSRIARGLDVLLLSTAVLAVLVLVQNSGVPNTDVFHARAVVRYGTHITNPDGLAYQLALPAVAALAFRTRHAALGWWRLAAMVLIGLALVATGTRGGALAAGAGLVTLAAVRPRIGARVLAALALVALLLPAVLPGGTLDILRARWATTSEDRLSGRLDIWRVGLAMIADRPLHGTGFGGFHDAFYEYMLSTPVDPHFGLIHSRGNRAPHNIYLSTFAELGLVGGGLLACALAAHARALWQLRRAARRVGHDQAEDIALALLATLATMLVAGSNGDILLEKTPWLLLAAMQGASIAAGWDGAAEVRP